MTPEELADEIEKLIVAANEKLMATIGKLQNLLYNRLNIVIKDLELDSEGYIKQSSANRKVLRDAQAEFDSTIKASGFAKAVETHLKTIPKLDSLNTDYFKSVAESFTTNRNFIKDLQRQTIQEVNQFILQDGLQANVKIPLNQILNANVNSGGSFSGFQEQLRDFIKGNEQAEGRLLRYVRTYVSDVLFNYSRAWQQAVTADLKLEFYLYSGGLTEKGKGSGGSRPFCIERAGKFFGHKEIEAWAAEDWQGKRADTTKSSIFIYCGGWNCRHSLIPVSDIIVPKDVIERNKG